jgi:hypothetical protein
MTPQAIHTLDWTAFAGGGFVVSVLFLALVERLRRTFATRQEVNGLGEKFNALQSLFLQVREATDEAHAAQATALEHILQRLDRQDATPNTRTRRQP